jgi:hypothetical protein
MQTTSFLKHRRFDPELIDSMSAAFASICRALGLSTSLIGQLRLWRQRSSRLPRAAHGPTEINLPAIEALRASGTGGSSLADHLAENWKPQTRVCADRRRDDLTESTTQAIRDFGPQVEPIWASRCHYGLDRLPPWAARLRGVRSAMAPSEINSGRLCPPDQARDPECSPHPG